MRNIIILAYLRYLSSCLVVASRAVSFCCCDCFCVFAGKMPVRLVEPTGLDNDDIVLAVMGQPTKVFDKLGECSAVTSGLPCTFLHTGYTVFCGVGVDSDIDVCALRYEITAAISFLLFFHILILSRFREPVGGIDPMRSSIRVITSRSVEVLMYSFIFR